MKAHKKQGIKVAYDPDADVLSIDNSSDARIDHAREMGNIVVHFGKDDNPILIEILEASRALRGQSKPLTQVADLALRR